jgi:capsule polysaccharide modification protein KpsS
MPDPNRVLALGWGPNFGCFLKQLQPFLLTRDHELFVIGVFEDRYFFGNAYIPLESLYSDTLASLNQDCLSDITRFEADLLGKQNYKFEGLAHGSEPSLDNLHAYARRLYHGMQTLISNIRPTRILCHGYGGYPAAILRCLSAQHGIRTWHFEHACFPSTIQMDVSGVNARSSLALDSLPAHLSSHAAQKLKEYDSGNAALLRPPIAAHYLHVAAKGRSFPLYPFSPYRGGALLRIFNVWARRYLFYTRPARLRRETRCLPNTFIFAPLQVHDDAQVVLNSPWVGSMEEWLFLLTKTCPPDVSLVIKLHPADRGRVSYRRTMRKVLQKRPDFFFVSELDATRLIDQCLGVVTINSTVGFEALLHHRPVIAAGHSFWTRDSLCSRASNWSELQHLLTLMASKALPDSTKRFENARLLLSHALDTSFPQGSFGNLSETQAESIVDRIVSD